MSLHKVIEKLPKMTKSYFKLISPVHKGGFLCAVLFPPIFILYFLKHVLNIYLLVVCKILKAKRQFILLNVKSTSMPSNVQPNMGMENELGMI